MPWSNSDSNTSLHYWCLGSSVGATLVTTTYGLEVGGDLSDKYLSAFETGVKSIHLFISGKSILEFLPILAHVPTWLPGAGYLRKLVDIRRATYRLRDLPWSDAREVVVSPPLWNLRLSPARG